MVVPPSSEVDCLTEAMFFESRDQGNIGMIDVAMNIFKRVSINYRKAESICEVVNSPAQYSYLWDDVPDVVLMEELSLFMRVHVMASEMVVLFYNQKLPEYSIGICKGGTTHYHRYDILPDWAGPNGSMHTKCGRRGDHIFYIGW